jgi:hypothetical protein
MEDREMPGTHKYGESKTTVIVMTTVRHVTAGAGRSKFQAAIFLLNRVYLYAHACLWDVFIYLFKEHFYMLKIANTLAA